MNEELMDDIMNTNTHELVRIKTISIKRTKVVRKNV